MSVGDWREVRIGEVISFNPSESLKKGEIVKKIAMEQLEPFTRKIANYELSQFTGGSKFRNGDTLLARITPCLENGKTAYVNILDDNEVAFGSTEFIVMRKKEKITDDMFVYYLAISPDFRNKAIQSMTGTSGRQRVQQDVLQSHKIILPPLHEQKAIAATLSVLDDMIELNNQINKTLEEMAQAIFKSWFVDFEPFKDGEFEESELGLIPKGWRVGVLGDIAFINTETINPQNFPETFFEHFSIPLFDEGKFSAFEKGEVIKSNKYVIDSSCILFSKLNPQFKRVFRPFCKTSKAICSTEFMVYKAKKPIYNNYIYSVLCSGGFYQFVMQNVTGTTNSRQRAIPKNTLNFKMLIPDENALSSYNQIISGIFNVMQRIPEDNKLLSSIRDTLLPKLMNGEIRVPLEEVV
ncbi:restriction endonuclease subunit S [Clostridium thermosuccinogenes]|uniref:restriction endonuclease subunit S n=1 Tax=Clostridium thermosuccinogenes TaxID=84032 RepID=UPI000CCC9DB1|nr:restriction endonuclease subunit S [Pseudoclostridium thermosuccinogenes]PNT93642.1 restriction endonuclease subunit S [Pseudoclostridium thermosuccinogenes]